MPSFFTPLAILHSGSAAPAGDVAAAAARLDPAPLTAAIAPDPVGLDLLARFERLTPDMVPAVLELVFDDPSGPTGLLARTNLGDTTWLVTDATGATSVVDNGGQQTIDLRSLQVVGGSPVWTPVPAARFSGAMLALVTADASDDVEGRALVQSKSAAWSTAAIGAFANGSSDNDLASLAVNAYQAITFRSGGAHAVQQNAGSQGGPAYPPQTLNQDAVLLDCVWSGVAPWGAVYVDTADVGVSSAARTRLPADVASNSAEAYQRYPAAFLRRPNFGRGVQVLEQVPDAITTGNGALTIYGTSTDLAVSAWHLQLDGAAFSAVLLRHANIAGLRRPADVWNRVIVPAMNKPEPLPYYRPGPGGLVLAGVLSRLEFLEYAAFLGGFTAELENAYTPIVQTGGVQGAGPTPPPPEEPDPG